MGPEPPPAPAPAVLLPPAGDVGELGTPLPAPAAPAPGGL
ncbi:hypothetical protein BZL30_1476 [Mycobacterium kansasii]|uniref:Uncharacterized protein n=1 Tax=Mycobacterium kansasii TaxID=1768 RepID=A0A1V3XUD2_MYCKA|nr:hypothetical protein BZL30_1476 [Mycobacterium kansasii]